MSKIRRNTGAFQVCNGKLLLYRVGPANGRKQIHNSCPRNMVTGEKEKDRPPSVTRRTPTPRGYWAFPFSFQDPFFYYHVYERQLPKRYLNIDTRVEDLAGYEITMKEIKKRTHPKLIWHGGPFYSHIKPKHFAVEQNWYRYDNAREWIEAARGHLWTYLGGGRFRCPYAVDHLEIFVPT